MRRLAVGGVETLTTTLRPVHSFIGKTPLAVRIFFHAAHASFRSAAKLLRVCDDVVIVRRGLEKLR